MFKQRLGYLSLVGSLLFTVLTLVPSAFALGTVYSFTNCLIVGKSGPSQANCNTSYSGTSLAGLVTISTAGLQLWTVPTTGSYTIEIAGARGGLGSADYGKGAVLSGTATLTAGEILKIVVGHVGSNGSYVDATRTASGGGGGASFIYRNTSTTLLVVAGGGGGGSGSWPGYTPTRVGSDASTTTTPTQPTGCSVTAALATGGNGGNNTSPGSAGGGGWLTAGATIGSSNGATPGYALSGTAIGGTRGDTGGDGGFGGGAGGRNVIAGPGGGYNGGNSPGDGGCNGGGGGGSSYTDSAFTQSSAAASNTGVGYVTFTFADASPPTVVSANLESSGNQITLTMNETLTSNTLAVDSFTVSASGSNISITSASSSGLIVVLNLGSALTAALVVTISYTDGAGDQSVAIQDTIGNDCATFISQAVTNNSSTKTPTSVSLSLQGGGNSRPKQSSMIINILVTATPTPTGTISLTFNGRKMPGCLVRVISAGSASCTWKPATSGVTNIVAAFNPTSATTYLPATSPILALTTTKRITAR